MGQPNKVVAHALGISARTVEFHRAHVMDKLGARNMSDLMRLALLAEEASEQLAEDLARAAPRRRPLKSLSSRLSRERVCLCPPVPCVNAG